MLTRGRVIFLLGALAISAVVLTGWQAYTVQQDLASAERSVARIQKALNSNDTSVRDQSIEKLATSASSAADTTGGPWWKVLTYVPLVGDDFEGIEVLSTSLDLIANEGIRPVADSVSGLDDVVLDGRIDVDQLQALQEPLTQASAVFADANARVSATDSSGYVKGFGSRFDDYAERLDSAASSLAAGTKAAQVLPSMLGGDAPRDYLLIFQNNAEIRATGGLPGSWAQIHAADGKLEIVRQGGAGDFPVTDSTILPLSGEESDVYGDAYGQYFQNPGFSPDFPRAAELWGAHWDQKFPEVPISGVIALDPVGLSYLIDGTGPIKVGSTRLTRDNLVEELLNRPYLELQPAEQDTLFEEAARAVFDAATGDLKSPVAFVEGMSRAAREGRFLVAPFVEDELKALSDTRVIGELSEDDGSTPHVDIGINDATAAKMSYYLRYSADVEARTCLQGKQQLSGTLRLRQAIAPAAAAALPQSVYGGRYGTEPGSQLLFVRLYGPFGGALESIRVSGDAVDQKEVTVIDGRPVVTLGLLLENRNDLVVEWAMETGREQQDDGEFAMTPSVVPGQNSYTFESACPPG